MQAKTSRDPKTGRRFSVRSAAERYGVSPATVQRVWTHAEPVKGHLEATPYLESSNTTDGRRDPSGNEVLDPGRDARTSPATGWEPRLRDLCLPRTPLFGRDRQLAELESLLPQVRLLTLCGIAGVGKTRLAVDLVAAHRDQCNGGRALVLACADLPGSATGTGTATTNALDDTAWMNAILGRLIDSAARLLIFDGCEADLQRASALAENLLGQCSALTIVATSQQPLGVDCEVIWRVPPLSIDQAVSLEGDAMAGSPAVEMFCHRVGSVRPELELDSERLALVHMVCSLLDGLPLAIQEAASLAGSLALQQILEFCEKELHATSESALGTLPQLRDALLRNHELLSIEEQILFRRLSVFPGPFTLEAAVEVAGSPPISGERVLTSLSGVDQKSLVNSEVAGPQARFTMLKATRTFAHRLLRQSGEYDLTCRRHADWCLRLASRESPSALDEKNWLLQIDEAQNDFTAARSWALSRGDKEAALRLLTALVPFWMIRGRFEEGRVALEGALASEGSASPSVQGASKSGAGLLAALMGDFADATALAEESLSSIPESDSSGKARALVVMGFALMFKDGPAAALPFLNEAVRLADRSRDTGLLAEAQARLGHAYMYQGTTSPAAECFESSISLARQSHNDHLEALAKVGLAWAMQTRGEPANAGPLLQEGLEISRRLGDRYRTAETLSFISEGLIGSGRLSDAEPRLYECLRLAKAIGSPVLQARACRQLASIALRNGETDRAEALFERAVSIARNKGLSFILVRSLQGLASLLASQDKLDAARRHLEECLVVAHERLDNTAVVQSLSGLATLSEALGETTRAAALHHQILQVQAESRHTSTMRALKSLAKIAAGRGDYATAVRLYAALQSQYQPCKTSNCPCGEESRPDEKDLAAAHEAFGGDKFSAAWQEGGRLSLEEAVAYASRGRGTRTRPSSGWPSLTPTENRVVKLVLEGFTNSEIGNHLFMSPRTVGAHLSHIYRKLGLSSRRELREAARERAAEVPGGAFQYAVRPFDA